MPYAYMRCIHLRPAYLTVRVSERAEPHAPELPEGLQRPQLVLEGPLVHQHRVERDGT